MTSAPTKSRSAGASILLPLALAQFVCSYAGSNMNVAVNSIATDLGTDIRGVQLAITLFTLTMAALMIPGSKLSDIWGRKVCLLIGLVTYGLGALIAALAPGLGVLIFGYSLLEGVGSALLIPPVYILVTVSFLDLTKRAKSFGIISAAAGIGSAAGPLIGGLITSAVSWRASFLLQVAIVVGIIILARGIDDPGITGAKPKFDLEGAVLSAAGLFFVVLGILQSGTYGWIHSRQDFAIGNTVIIHEGGISPVWLFVAIGAFVLALFFFHIRAYERAKKLPLLAMRLFQSKTANLGLVTQGIQWLILQGAFFVVSVFLQTVRGYSAVQTGLILTPSTIGVLISSLVSGRLAKRFSQRFLIRIGFVLTIAGMCLLLVQADATSGIMTFIPGLFLMGLGIGTMLTSSVNVVQSSFPEKDQGEISGLSRSVSNLGSSFGTALVGSILVSSTLPGNRTFGLALATVTVIACIGLVAALCLPSQSTEAKAE